MTTSIDPQYTPPENSNEPSWHYDEGMPGSGDRPEWLPEKFKTVADAAKSYSELEKRLGNAPKEYDLSKGEKWIDKEYEPFKEMLDVAKSKHVSQDVMDKMLDSVGKYLDEFKIDYSQEKAKLGENADQRLEVIDNWAKSNFSKETYDALTNNLNTADAVKAIEEVRNKMNANATAIPTGQDILPGAPTLQEVQSELNKNLDKYKTDPTYRAKITSMIELASKNSGYEDKRAY